ncbi:hypothetical protein ABZ352_18945 [Streptomyces griseofuscus]|uniref:hypothetical protein n=1 Tax=Streptomyces griseofuscus TaxID=146922 RepID=UPI0033F4255C
MKAEDLYLGWTELAHAKDCRRPAWEAQTRTEWDTFRGGRNHSCPDEDCGHQNRYSKTTFRLVCRSCGNVHLMDGELGSSGGSSVERYGYGQQPKKVGGLYLYPGATAEWITAPKSPWDYLVTAEKVDRITKDNLVGSIGQGRTPRGRVIWSAGARPTFETGLYGTPLVTYTVVSGKETFSTPTAAARWIEQAIR